MLTAEHYKELVEIEGGADIIGYRNAKLLREIEEKEPSFIKVCKPVGNYDAWDTLPFFGAIATKKGVKAAKRVLKENQIRGGDIS